MTDNVTSIEAKRREAVPEVVETLRELLQKAEAGEVRLLVYCAWGLTESQMNAVGEPHDQYHLIGSIEAMKLDVWAKHVRVGPNAGKW